MVPADKVHVGSHQPDNPPPTMTRHMDSEQPEESRRDAATRRVRNLVGRDKDKVEPRPALLDAEPAPPDPEGPDPADDHLTLSLTAAQTLVADFIASDQENPERRAKMDNVIARLRETIDLTLPAGTASHFAPVGYLAAVGEHLAENDRLSFLIELYFLDPFAPYTLKYRDRVRREALRRVAVLMGDDKKSIRRIKKTGDEALKSHSKQNWAKVGLIGIGAAVVLGIGGFMAAPILGAALGAGAGLAGAAATAHGLALLGGGALAAGGAGMAGGMWLVAGAGAALGAVAGGGGVKLYQLGADQARGELVKLQVTFKLTLLQDQADQAKAQAVVANLAAQAEELKQKVEEERQLNDDNARRVKDLEDTLEALEETILWMRSQDEDAA